jgi:triacylglycerol esterase/lipase EstA (alpha/beta hydrolase family)
MTAIAAIGATGFVASATTATAAPVSNCRPSAAHPFPVVLVHGTFENSTMWSQFQPVLRQAGYCVSAIDYVSTQEISISAAQLAGYVNQVLAATGASKVDIVGHSQGGMLPRYT